MAGEQKIWLGRSSCCDSDCSNFIYSIFCIGGSRRTFYISDIKKANPIVNKRNTREHTFTYTARVQSSRLQQQNAINKAAEAKLQLANTQIKKELDEYKLKCSYKYRSRMGLEDALGASYAATRRVRGDDMM
jgi:hypothetical protein